MGLVRAFTEALGQQPIIQALQLRDIPKLECAGAFDRRKELQLGRIFFLGYIYIYIAISDVEVKLAARSNDDMSLVSCSFWA